MNKKEEAERAAATAADFGVEDRLLPLSVVVQIAGIGRTMIYRLMREGRFPQHCKPGGSSSRWSEREVVAWVERQLAARPA